MSVKPNLMISTNNEAQTKIREAISFFQMKLVKGQLSKEDIEETINHTQKLFNEYVSCQIAYAFASEVSKKNGFKIPTGLPKALPSFHKRIQEEIQIFIEIKSCIPKNDKNIDAITHIIEKLTPQ